MTESEHVFLDTNILIYQTFEDFDPEKHQYVCRLLKYLSKNNFKIFISSQVLKEFIAISTNGKFFERPLDIQEAVSKVDEFRKNFKVLYDNESSIEKLKQVITRYRITKQDVHDANIAATMIAHNLKNLATFNTKDFDIFEEIDLFQVEIDEAAETDTA